MDEIEVTSEMIAAGRDKISAVWLDFISDHGVYMWTEVLTAVYLAMYEARTHPNIVCRTIQEAVDAAATDAGRRARIIYVSC